MIETRQNRHPRERERRFAERYSPRVEPINRLVDDLRRERDRDESIPYVDPDSGGVHARILWLMQDPGPKASITTGGSGILSWQNDDPTAETVCLLFAQVGLGWLDVCPWNAIPWYTAGANTGQDTREGAAALRRLLPLFEDLRVVVVLGAVAEKAWALVPPALAGSTTMVKTFHTSNRGITNGSRQSRAEGLRHVAETLRQAKRLAGIAGDPPSGTCHQMR